MNKRTRIIIAAVIAVLGLGALVYYLFAGRPALVVDTGGTFGSSDNRNVPETGYAGPVQGAGVIVAPRLMRITEGPVAKGAIALYVPPVSGEVEGASTTTQTAPPDVEVRYVERASGNVYAFRVHDRVLTRISNRTLPGVQEAHWVDDGSRVFVRYLTRTTDGSDRVDTYMLPASGGEGYFLEQGVSAMSISSSTVLSLLPSANGSTGTLSSADGTNVRTLFTTAINALQVTFSGANIVATTNASSGLDGYSFFVNGSTGAFTRILGPFKGLTTLASPYGKYVLYSYVDRGALKTQVLDMDAYTGTPLPLGTIAEKCVWASERSLYCAIPTAVNGNLPDDWYQGAFSFSDRIWEMNLDTRLASLVVDPKEVADVDIDAISLTLDPNNDLLIFTNKRDGSLWSYDF